MLTQSGGNLSITTSSGAGVTQTGTLNLASGYQLQLSLAAPLNNSGTINVNNAFITGIGTVSNQVGGMVVGPGKLGAFVNDGIVIPGSGMLQIGSNWTNSATGVVLLSGPTSNLGALDRLQRRQIQGNGIVSAPLSNSAGGTVEALGGTLIVSGTLTNLAGNTIAASSGNKVLVTSGLATNAGLISLAGGTFDNASGPSRTPARSPDSASCAGTITNDGAMTLTGGVTTVNANVTNNAGRTINVKHNPAIFTGSVTNNGTIKITNTVVTFTGAYSGAVYISDPSDNIFQADVTVTPGGTMSGGGGDRFFLSGGTFTNHGTFDNGGLLQSADNATNHGTFNQAGPQSWSAGTTFTNAAGNDVRHRRRLAGGFASERQRHRRERDVRGVATRCIGLGVGGRERFGVGGREQGARHRRGRRRGIARPARQQADRPRRGYADRHLERRRVHRRHGTDPIRAKQRGVGWRRDRHVDERREDGTHVPGGRTRFSRPRLRRSHPRRR